MSSSRIENAILSLAKIPDLLREPVLNWFDGIREASGHQLRSLASSNDDQITLIRLVASSEFAANVIARDPNWFADTLREGVFGRTAAGGAPFEIDAKIDISKSGVATAKSRLRQLRNQRLLHILWRSVSNVDSVDQTLNALSLLADSLVSAATQYAERTLQARFGEPVNSGGQKIALITLAMGKLGGGELNFSSDIDLVFLYTDEGESDGPRTLSAHEYFTRLTRQIVSLLDELTSDGFVYRVDTRLRPFGDSGPPVVSSAALENYLLEHGRGWERYAYIKARAIGVSATSDAVHELQANVIEPFVYRRYLDFGVFESLRNMKALIEVEVKKRELQGNIKLGPGGIREIEFIAQSLQLVRGGADPQLRRRKLRHALNRLEQSKSLEPSIVSSLLLSYHFLRKLENGMQAIRDQQTHELPKDPADRARLLVVMQQASWGELIQELDWHRKQVSSHFADIVFRGNTGKVETELTAQLAAHWNASAPSEEWASLLSEHSFEEAEELAVAISEFSSAATQRKIDVTAQKRLTRFMCALLVLLRERHRPAAVCSRVLAVVAQILRRSAYVALLNENPAVLVRLVRLCGQSAYLAEEIARFPLLLDELLDPRLYSAEISATAMGVDVSERLKTAESDDSERRIELLAQFQRATLFRIAVADVSGNLTILKVSDRLTDLAEIVLEQALHIAWSDLVERHGMPVVDVENISRHAGFGVIAYGKLGGMELSYRSDLDLVFLHDSRGEGQATNGEKPLENSMFFGRLARRLVHFLTVQTGSGALYDVDTRLRPSGRSGLLVVNTDGFERYQEENAWTWEHQALLRSRAVAGSAAVAREFERIRVETLCNRVHIADLRDNVIAMRKKMRWQLDKSDSDQFDLKQGEGGIGDIEFLVQYLVLRNARTEPALVHYSDNIRQLGTLEAVGILSAKDAAELQNAFKVYRLRAHRLALDAKPALVSANEFIDERAIVALAWQREMNLKAVD